MPKESEILIKRALISVSDKSGLVEFGQALAEFGIEILSTGGTAQVLRENGVSVKDVADHTGFPEIMGGRVKTLHPKIHGGILARRANPDDEDSMKVHGIESIDLVVINLYPFAEVVSEGMEVSVCIENIDIGGPAMIRAAAKNHTSVAIATDPEDYLEIIESLKSRNGRTNESLRSRLATKAFSLTASYDSSVATYLSQKHKGELPKKITFSGKRKSLLRYGENPHQRAALYIEEPNVPCVANAELIQGKELSYNNIADADAALEIVSDFSQASIAIIKHANPCGVAINDNPIKAYRAALACDPTSAFGGIVASNRALNRETAEAITETFTEVVVAPDADEDALSIFSKKQNLRLLLTRGSLDVKTSRLMAKPIFGGLLVQDRDNNNLKREDLQFVTKRKPSEEELSDLMFAFTICKHVKSNAIIYAHNGATVGIGAGQMRRIDSARIAAWKASEAAEASSETRSKTVGSVVASDAFFPFPDGLLATVEAGATSVIQPGGSVRDEEVIDAANEAGIAMVFTGIRHFKH